MTRMLTIPDAAELLNVSENTVRRIIASGKLPASKIGGQLRMTEEALEFYVRQQRVRVPAPISAPAPRKRGRPTKEMQRGYYPGMKVV